MKFKFLAAVAALGMAISAQAANIKTFQMTYSGAALGNSAVGTGYFTTDLDRLGDYSAITDLSLTISGASFGNGTFGLSDFSFYVFNAPSQLDYTRELIGQTLGNGCLYGTSDGPCGNGQSGDFNLFGSSQTSPNGTYYFRLSTFGGAGDSLYITSLNAGAEGPADAPEPASLALLGGGLAALAVRARRKQAAKTA